MVICNYRLDGRTKNWLSKQMVTMSSDVCKIFITDSAELSLVFSPNKNGDYTIIGSYTVERQMAFDGDKEVGPVYTVNFEAVNDINDIPALVEDIDEQLFNGVDLQELGFLMQEHNLHFICRK